MNRKFLINWGLSTLFFVVLVFLGSFFGLIKEQTNWFWIATIFFSGLSLLVGWISLRGITSKSNMVFMRSFFSALGIRMFFGLIFITIYLFAVAEKDNMFIGYFLFLYLFFTIFEIYQLLAKLRTEKKEYLEDTIN